MMTKKFAVMMTRLWLCVRSLTLRREF